MRNGSDGSRPRKEITSRSGAEAQRNKLIADLLLLNTRKEHSSALINANGLMLISDDERKLTFLFDSHEKHEESRKGNEQVSVGQHER